ncbi:CDC48 family AAA ATPase [Flexibacterium corallicola]|uniref:CDC48 family AAA ATPase n=1 Tax=Flexibacterium corallicola TaxID=3037259 RepID=UPI00286F9D30|nr:CDC48 family AAA ATPase [Pseudovibrio sp. M1P-2-3]
MSEKQVETKDVEVPIELKVAEAAQPDVGRGLVRLDPADIRRVGIKIGDVVEIKGKRSAFARVVPAHAEHRDQKLIAMDGIMRSNADAGLGEQVSVCLASVEPAKSVKLVPESGRGVPGHQLTRLLQGIPVTKGDRVRLSSFGANARHFTVSETKPKGPVLIGTGSSIRCEAGKASNGSPIITYEDIGGLKRELSSIREMIELPLKYPQVFEQLGIDAPKGVLMHGPPGCGKTLIARAVAHEADARFFVLSGPEIMHKHYGESEAHLRKVFEEASKAPSIIFLDEIDAIAPKRNALGTEQQVERRVVSQLLTLMDGLSGRGHVIVIGATNLPDAIDPALRRPGRFDREIVIGVPDRLGRHEILNVHTRGMPLSDDVDLERLAQVTYGFVGADLQSLAREAAMARLRRVFEQQGYEFETIQLETLEGLNVDMEDFQHALTVVEPSAIREVFTEIPSVKWGDVGGLSHVKQLLEEAITWPLSYPDLFNKVGISPPKGVLLNGPPGVGKTLVAKALATESGVNFISIKGPALMSKWVGESERAVREVFHKAKLASPCILFLDEVDSIAPRRGGGDTSAVTDRIIAQLLTEMDGVEELRDVLVLAATNRKDLVDTALLRAGRFDYVVDLPLPSLEARQEIYRVHTRDKPLSPDVKLKTLAVESEGRSGADIELHCRKAASLAIRAFLNEGFDPENQTDQLKIERKHFVKAKEDKGGPS